MSTPVIVVGVLLSESCEEVAAQQLAHVRGPFWLKQQQPPNKSYHKILLLIWRSPSAIHLTIVDRLWSVENRFLCLSKQM